MVKKIENSKQFLLLEPDFVGKSEEILKIPDFGATIPFQQNLSKKNWAHKYFERYFEFEMHQITIVIFVYEKRM